MQVPRYTQEQMESTWDEIFAALFRAAGFSDPTIRTIRKRTSKKELFEFVVSARKPGKAID